MTDPVLMLVEYGGYLSIVKLCSFLLFFPSWALINWTYKDAKSIDANEVMWTAIMLGTLVVTVLLWFMVPIYTVGLVLYLVGMLGTGLAYVKYRNARVLDFDKVLTVEHIKAVLTQSDQEDEGQENFTFITANKNEVPRPKPRTPDFFGYRAAYDILLEALKQRAESITFVPGPETFKATYQIDGASVPQADQPKEQMEYFVRFVKQVGGLNEKERRKPQKGLFKTRQGKETVEWQITTAGSTAGEQVRIEKVTKEQAMRLSELGLTSKQTEMWHGLRECRGGVYIISGPRASGLTSSFYSLLSNHDAYMNSIHTLEKEITGQLPSITQEHYSLSDTASVTYAQKLEKLFRMEPDVVGVAECVDTETAKSICEAARTGKLVYVIIEADSALQALGRWLKLVGDRKTAVEHMVGLSNQRLLRKLCPECKQGYAPNQDILKKFNLPADKAKVLYRPGKVVFDKRGKESACADCHSTGFVGRTGVYETITLNSELSRVILTCKTLQDMGIQFRRAKMVFLQEQALRKVLAGETAINEMVRVLTPAKKAKAKQTK